MYYFITMKNSEQKKIDIYNYFDYYDYLKDQYEFLKKNSPGFSFRAFAKTAGITSHSYFLRIVQRKRKLSSDYIINFCKALQLDADECEYFNLLVSFNNEKNPRQKEIYLKLILNLRYNRKAEYRLADEKLKFYEYWYYPVMRELAVIVDFKEDYALLARKCVPKITPAQAKGAIQYLVENNFLKKDRKGRYRLVDYFISTGKEVNSTILRKYHRTTIKQASEAVDTIKPEKRDISSLTLRVNKNTYLLMKNEIQNFRKHLLDVARECQDPDMVCFVGLQLFPRSVDTIDCLNTVGGVK